MESVRKILIRFWDLPDKFPDSFVDTVSGTSGFYAYENGKCVAISESSIQGLGFTKMAQKMKDGIIVPIFHHENIGETRKWVPLYDDNLGSIDIAIVKFAALLKPYVTAPTLDDIKLGFNKLLEIHPNITAVSGRIGTVLIPLFKEIAEYVDYQTLCREIPWIKRSFFRDTLTMKLDTGAEINLPDDVDFQDIFMALADIADFMRSPDPELIVTNSTKFHMKRLDNFVMTGVFGPLSMTVSETISLYQNDNKSNVTVRSQLESIYTCLRNHQIIRSDSQIKEVYTYKLYFESHLELNQNIIYLMCILKPQHHMRNFYIDETTKIIMKRDNNGIYYCPDGGKSRKLKLIKNVPKRHIPNLRMKSYTVETTLFEHENPATLKANLGMLLYDIDHYMDKIAKLLQILPEAKSIAVENTPLTTSNLPKSRGTISKIESGKEKPVKIPGDLGCDYLIAFNTAQLLAHRYGNEMLGSMYVIHNSEIIRIGEAPDNLFYPNYYINCKPKTNIVNIGSVNAPVPGLEYIGKVKASSIPNNLIIDMDPSMSWLIAPSKHDRIFFDAISCFFIVGDKRPKKSIYPDHQIITRDDLIAQFLRLSQDPENPILSIMSPEFFDCTPEEICHTLKKPDPFLHFRLLEYVLGSLLLVFEPKEITSNGCTVTAQIPRNAGTPYRNYYEYKDAILLLKTESRYDRVYVKSAHSSEVTYRVPVEDLGSVLAGKIFTKLTRLNFKTGAVYVPTIDEPLDQRLTIVSQTVNHEGLATSYTVTANEDDALAFFSQDATKDMLSKRKVTFTINLILPSATVIAPIKHTETIPISKKLSAKIKPFCDNVETIDDETHYVRDNYVLVETDGNHELKSNPKFDYANHIAVLISVTRWYILNHLDEEINIRPSYERLHQLFMENNMDFYEIGVRHRFLPPSEDTLDTMLQPYFPCGMPMVEETILKLLAYFDIEIGAIMNLRNRTSENFETFPRECQSHIDGIHPAFEGLKTETVYGHPSRGGRTIVRSWKDYEYAVTRAAAKENMKSWEPVMELSLDHNALDLKDHSAFVVKVRNGVVYAVACHSATHAEKQLKKEARKRGYSPDFMPKTVFGMNDLINWDFNKNPLFIFNTSTEPAQGTYYSMQCFA